MKIAIILALALSVIFIFMRFKPLAPAATLVLAPSPSPSPAPRHTEKAVLKDVSGGYGVGLATKTVIGDEFIFSVSAQLSPPPDGKFYEAWLVKRTPEPDVIPIGKLMNSETQHLWETTLRTLLEYSEYRQVSITLEKEDDNVPEKTILRGTFAEEK